MSKLLTISIPTYNRLYYLSKCLNQLLNQVSIYTEDICVFVTDNCSTDGTQEYMQELAKKYSFIEYHRNEKNIGYSGNQINCVHLPTTKYIAILCDDDLYLDGALDTIIPVLKSKQEWSMVALNYYGFKNDFRVPSSTNFAPPQDKIFSRPYDLMNYPSVGHYSGLLFNGKEAKEILEVILKNYDFTYYEQQRGVIFDIACRLLAKSKYNSFFIGKRILANYEQESLDYDSLPHLCIEYYKYFLLLFDEKIITESDLLYRKDIVLAKLPRNAFSSLCTKPKKLVEDYWSQLNDIGLITNDNKLVLSCIFFSAKYKATKAIMRLIYKIYKQIKNN